MHALRWFPLILLFGFTTSFANTEIKTNPFDEREFESLILQNGLKVLLISDPKAEKSAAALDVYVGSGEDPVERFGLAHFLEHMLFLGTEKYPTPGEFQDYVAGHGGNHNAYTSLMHTNYFFDVDTQAFESALDRFSQFFVSPLFLAPYVERERQAVHSEYTSKISQGARREKDVFRELLQPGHALAKFSTGSMATLGNVAPETLRNELISFYKRHYSADIMSLVVFSSLPIDELKAMVLKRFTDVPNLKEGEGGKESENGVAKSEIAAFPSEFFPAEIHITPKKQRRKLSVLFPVKDSRPYTSEKPLYYIGNLLGHEGKGSLFSLLKNKGWATALGVGTNVKWRSGEMFGMNIHLTEKGFENIDHIYELIFSTIDLITSKGVARWRFEELSDLSKTSFAYGERGDPIREVSRIAHNLHETPVKDLFWQPYDFSRYDEALIRDYLSQLTKDKALVTVVAPGLKQSQASRFYQTPYHVVKGEGSLFADAHRASISGSGTGALSSSVAQLSLPKKNPFVAKNFSIIEPKQADADTAAKPAIVVKKDRVTGWYLNDNIYDLPKTSVSTRFKLPQVAQSPEHFVAAKIYVRILKDSLNQTSYDAALAGVSYSLMATARGLDLDFYGYSDSIRSLSKHVVRAIRRFNGSKRLRKKVLQENFPHVRRELLRIQKNRQYDKVYAQLLGEVPSVLYSPYWSAKEVEAAYEKITQARFAELVAHIFDDGQLDAFVFGNIKERHAKKHITLLSKLLKNASGVEVPEGQVVKLEGPQHYLKHITVESSDSAVVLYFQAEDDSLEARARLGLLEKMISTPLYRSLRTEQQLGYIVFSANYPMRDVPGMLVVVQSPKYSGAEIYEKIRAFFKDEEGVIFENFERDKSALMVELAESPKNQIEWSDLYWNSILEYDQNFDRIQRLLNMVQGISAESLKGGFKRVFVDSSPALLFVASKTTVSPGELSDSLQGIDDNQRFKANMPTYRYP